MWEIRTVDVGIRRKIRELKGEIGGMMEWKRKIEEIIGREKEIQDKFKQFVGLLGS